MVLATTLDGNREPGGDAGNRLGMRRDGGATMLSRPGAGAERQRDESAEAIGRGSPYAKST
jgi:hypothetical protein